MLGVKGRSCCLYTCGILAIKFNFGDKLRNEYRGMAIIYGNTPSLFTLGQSPPLPFRLGLYLCKSKESKMTK